MKRPPVHINISRTEGVGSAIVMLTISGIGCHSAARLTSLWSTVAIAVFSAFMLFLACFTVYSVFSRRFFYGKSDHEIIVIENELTVLERISGKRDTIAWPEVTTIGTWARYKDTDEDGYRFYDRYWCISGEDSIELSAPFYCRGHDAFVEHIRSLPGFDEDELAVGMRGQVKDPLRCGKGEAEKDQIIF